MAEVKTLDLFNDIKNFIEQAKNDIARVANSKLVGLYWQIGNRINHDILKNERAEYGEQILKSLSIQLSNLYGSGFDRPNLSRMIQVAKLYPDQKICVTLSQQLSWSHFVKLITIDEPIKRDFYTEMCRLQGWTVRELRNKVDTMLFERTAIAKKPESIIKTEIENLKQGSLMNPDLRNGVKSGILNSGFQT